MEGIQLAVVGGFLGAGKTTTILALAKKLLAAGMKVGIVTNDQGSDLVDTQYLASQGLPVLEVNGGCFCCNFDEFTQKVEALAQSELPDVILAEPVGSCTDLVATIFRPIKQQNLFNICPLTVVADPRRVMKLMMHGQSPFPDEINYLFEQQIEEADVILLNKVDTLDAGSIDKLLAYLRKRFLGRTVLPISAKAEQGLELWLGQVLTADFAERILPVIDYERYGRAEQYLGWLNATATLKSETLIDVDAFLLTLTLSIQGAMQGLKCQIAHLKLYAIGGVDQHAKISVVDLDEAPDFARRFEGKTKSVQLVINARIVIAPETLSREVEAAVYKTCEAYGLKVQAYHADCFVPGWPNPTHRMINN